MLWDAVYFNLTILKDFIKAFETLTPVKLTELYTIMSEKCYSHQRKPNYAWQT